MAMRPFRNWQKGCKWHIFCKNVEIRPRLLPRSKGKTENFLILTKLNSALTCYIEIIKIRYIILTYSTIYNINI